MCDALADRLDLGEKGASFLILRGDGENCRFYPVALFHHDREEISRNEIPERLTVHRGLAAQAVREGRCVILEDCLRAPDDVDWVSTLRAPEYRGRAVMPVRGNRGGRASYIGALCFDVKRPWSLGPEDQALMHIFALKIASFWDLLSEDNGTFGRLQRRRYRAVQSEHEDTL